MTLIKRSLIEGKIVGFYDFDAPLIDHCLKQAIEIMDSKKFHEYRFSLNGVEFVLNGTETFEELKKFFHESINAKNSES